ncbi:MAG: hypothetical protein CFH15_00175 [Alphaproteobacteria bacterium MarineAlpha5_Bin5]|nr:MAG: hypothetical protein CFH15_00175 [Alphaproteobacteria bacterium MarineAlpha5_Bin5]
MLEYSIKINKKSLYPNILVLFNQLTTIYRFKVSYFAMLKRIGVSKYSYK